MKKILPLCILFLIISCKNNEKLQENSTLQKVNSFLKSNMSLEQKYDSIYETGLIGRNNEISIEQEKEIGNSFFNTSVTATQLEILPNGKINLLIKGNVVSNFKDKSFDKYTFVVTTKIKIGKKNFTSGQLFDASNNYPKSAEFEIHHKLINDIEASFGKEDFIWLDKSYLNYKPSECQYIVELIAENKVGEMYKVTLLTEDFYGFWTNSAEKINDNDNFVIGESLSDDSTTETNNLDLTLIFKNNQKLKLYEISKLETIKDEIIKKIGKELYNKYILYSEIGGDCKIIADSELFYEGCKLHNCIEYQSVLFVNKNKNYYYAGLFDSPKIYVFSNDPNFKSDNPASYPIELENWKRESITTIKEFK